MTVDSDSQVIQGQTPLGDGAAQSGNEQTTFTTQEVENLVNTRLAALKQEIDRETAAKLTAAGREAKALEARAAALEAKEREIEMRERREAEEAGVEELSAYERELEARKRIAEANRIKDDVEAVRAENSRLKRETEAVRIAAAEGVDSKILLDLTDGSPEKMQALAKLLKPSQQQPAPAKPQLKTDSGFSKGAAASWEQVRAAYSKNPEDPQIATQYLQMRRQRY